MTRLAVVGCRDLSGIEVVLGRLRGGRIAAVVDEDRRIVHDAAVALGASVAAQSLGELLDGHENDVDGVFIRSCRGTRATLVRKAAEAGKHTMVVPPLGLSAAEAEEAIAVCSASGARLMVANPARHMPRERLIKQTLDDGRLGAPGLLRVHRWAAAGECGADGLTIADLVNEIDLSHWLFGSAAATVYAVGRRLGGPDSDRPDFVQLHLGFPDGGMALIDYAATLPPGDGYTSVSMVGSTGGVHGDDARNVNLVYGGGAPSAIAPGYGDGHVLALLQEFVDSISEGREPDNGGSDALAAIQVAEAARESMASGRAASLTGGRYEPV
jgi:predicted dehydrogenase